MTSVNRRTALTTFALFPGYLGGSAQAEPESPNSPQGQVSTADAPASVAAKAWSRKVWRLQHTAGPKVKPTKKHSGSAKLITITSQTVIERYDFRDGGFGFDIYADTIFRNCRFRSSLDTYPIAVRKNAKVIIEDCEIDGAVMGTQRAGLVTVWDTALAQVTGTRFKNSKSVNILTAGPGTPRFESRWNVYNACPVDVPAAIVEPHGEASHPMSGSFSHISDLFDFRDGRGRARGVSAQLFIEGVEPISKAMVRNCIFVGAKDAETWFAIGSFSRVNNARFRNLIIQRAKESYFYPDNQLSGVVERTNIIDFDTGRIVYP